MTLRTMHRLKKKKRASEEDDDSKDETVKSVVRLRNCVFFHSEVTRATILNLIEELDAAELHALTNGCTEVMLFIHSEGGDAYAGLSGMDHMSRFRIPIHTVADGFVASAATFLLLGGTKRSCMPSCAVLIHQVSTGFWGKFNELKDEVANTEQLMGILTSLYKRKTNMRKKQITSLLDKELTLSAQDCIDNGIVTGFYAP